MEKYLFVPYFCNKEYKNAAIENAKGEEEKSKIEKTYGIHRRWIFRPAVAMMVDKYLNENNPLAIKDGELYNSILRTLSNKRINVFVEKAEKTEAPKKEIEKTNEPAEENHVETVETTVETEPVMNAGTEVEETCSEEKPVEEKPKATSKKKKSNK